MPKIKIAITLFIVLFLISFLLFFLPVDEYINRLPYVRELYNNTSLTINTTNGKAVVEIDGKNHGESPVDINELPEGQHKVTLTRVSENKEFYKPVTFYVNLYRNTETLVNMEIAPAGLYAGYILNYSASPQTASDSGYLTISSTPETSSTYLDDEFLARTPINGTKLNSKKYTLKVSKENYESLEFPVIIRNKYNLNVKTYLLPIPVQLDQTTQ